VQKWHVVKNNDKIFFNPGFFLPLEYTQRYFTHLPCSWTTQPSSSTMSDEICKTYKKLINFSEKLSQHAKTKRNLLPKKHKNLPLILPSSSEGGGTSEVNGSGRQSTYITQES
jgi:hypothetical protein